MSIIMLENKRHAFPALGRPAAIGDGEPAYGTRLIIDPNDPDVERIEKAMLEAATLRWKEDAKAVLDMLKEDKKVCFERAPYRNKKTGKVYDGFEGKFNLGTRNPKNRPTAVDLTGKKIEDASEIERIIYSGCFVNAKVEFWAQDNQWGRRLNCSLLGIMFADHGASFGGGAAPADADDFAKYAKPVNDLM